MTILFMCHFMLFTSQSQGATSKPPPIPHPPTGITSFERTVLPAWPHSFVKWHQWCTSLFITVPSFPFPHLTPAAPPPRPWCRPSAASLSEVWNFLLSRHVWLLSKQIQWKLRPRPPATTEATQLPANGSLWNDEPSRWFIEGFATHAPEWEKEERIHMLI